MHVAWIHDINVKKKSMLGWSWYLRLSKARFSIVLVVCKVHQSEGNNPLYLSITSIGICRPICSRPIVTPFGSWYTFIYPYACMHHAETNTSCMNTYTHTNEIHTYKTHKEWISSLARLIALTLATCQEGKIHCGSGRSRFNGPEQQGIGRNCRH